MHSLHLGGRGLRRLLHGTAGAANATSGTSTRGSAPTAAPASSRQPVASGPDLAAIALGVVVLVVSLVALQIFRSRRSGLGWKVLLPWNWKSIGRPEPDQEQAAVAAADQLAAELQATGKAPCIVVMPDEQLQCAVKETEAGGGSGKDKGASRPLRLLSGLRQHQPAPCASAPWALWFVYATPPSDSGMHEEQEAAPATDQAAAPPGVQAMSMAAAT